MDPSSTTPPAKPELRVVIVDDHPILRSGLRALVDAERDMRVVGEAADGVAALAAVSDAKPNVVVMDVSMPTLGGAEATARIKAMSSDVQVLALSAHDERAYVQSLLAAGASGYLLKRAAAAELIRAIRAIACGGVYLDPAVAGQLVSERKGPARRSQLSEREIEVLRMLAQGHGVKETAAKLAISTRTLDTYRARATEKLGLKTRAEIVRYALQMGWLKND